MRKTLIFNLLIFCLVLGFTFTTLAQQEYYSLGKAPKKSKEEVQQLIEYYAHLNLPVLDALEIGYGSSFDLAGFVNNDFCSLPVPAGLPITDIATYTTLIQGGDIANGIFYGTDANALVTFDLGTGAKTTVATITGVNPSQTITALSYYEAAGIMYMGTTDITTSQLYTIDLNTGVATLVGNIGQPGLIAIATSCTGEMYSVDLVQDNLWSIDRNTGVGTAIGLLGYDANYAQDADWDNADGTMYLSAYNNATSGEFRSVNVTTGSTTLLAAWPNDEITAFGIDATCGPPCPVGDPTNPNPPSGTTGVPLTGNTASWTNGAGTTQVELWFGPLGSLTQAYIGAPITSFALPTLNYATTYGWYVKCWNDTCFSQGPTWTFTTMADPNQSDFCDDFDNLSNWTVVGPFGQSNWSASNTSTAGGTPPELYMNWTPSFTGVSTVRSVVMPNFLNNTLVNYEFKFYLDWFANPSGVVTVGMTYDGGATSIPFYTLTDPTSDVGPLVVQGSFTTPATGSQNGQIEITYNGYSFNINWIAFDDLCLDWVIPVELTSFTAKADYGVVELQWTTATETNNLGFEVQRNYNGEFITIAFVEGHGTTTEVQNYSFVDKNVNTGSVSYRLRQVDFNGSFEYSNVVEANVPAPAEFALDQNYPNPFNPSTKIAFRLAVDSKVSLKVFDVLGQEVANLVNTNLGVGAHSVDFDASSLNSGVYLYRIEATGIDGTNFVDVKKMILTK